MGAGKTTFTQGLAAGLGIKQVITSPTFVILKNYAVFEHTQGITQLVHIDTYRIKNEKELEGIGALDFFEKPDTVCVIEWPEKLVTLLDNFKCITILLEHGKTFHERMIRIQT